MGMVEVVVVDVVATSLLILLKFWCACSCSWVS